MLDFKKIKKAHFVGIKGSGLSALARTFLLMGIGVSGSDLSLTGHDAQNVPIDADVLIYTIAAAEENPEILRAKELGIPCFSYPEALGLISESYFTIAVAGTHGKTTTTNMVGKILQDAELAPLVIAGAEMQDGDSVLEPGDKYFVVEACEYRRSFLNISPDIIVITNIDEDHLDYYKNRADIESAF